MGFLFADKSGGNLKDTLAQLPGWAWPFVGLCLFIPVLTLGGAFPVGIGLAGAMSCATVAKDNARKQSVRVLMCLAITVGAWVALGVLLVFIARRH